jgi:GT2 family glycosyltransferase
MSCPPHVSVIVPTFNRASSLERLLKSFDSFQYRDSVTVEVVVVDNGSTDGTRSLLEVESKRPRTYKLRVKDEPRQGKSHALNRGLQVATGRFFMILDDDVIAHSELLESHMECYESSRFDALQGKILPGLDPDGKPAVMARLREYNIPYVDYGEDCCEIRGLTGTNMSFKREVYEAVGTFDTRLGPGKSGFSEDTEYSMRIKRAGFKIGYCPGAIVFHELNPARYGRGYNRRVAYRKGMSRSIYRHDSIVFTVVPSLLVNGARFCLYSMAARRQKAFKTEGRLLKSWGYLMGKIRGTTGNKLQ